MPSVIENRTRWSEHPWTREGHEWSPGQTAAGGEMLWWRSLLPRIASHLPAERILEIGPGFGRWTRHLLLLSEHLTAIDVTERCIEHCRERFEDSGKFDGWTNDGESLEMVPDASVDFVFSFDSLVHAEASVLQGYLQQLAHKLKPGGTGFIHHSNLGSFARDGGSMPRWLVRRNWRAESMSARLFREYCAEAGLVCTSQEVINWISRSRRADRHRIAGARMPLTDTMSAFRKPHARDEATQPTRVYLNAHFADEWREIVLLAAIYAAGMREDEPAVASGAPLERAARVLRRQGISGVLARLRERASRAGDYASSLVRERALAVCVGRNEPILNAFRRRCCPDCRGPLAYANRCAACRVEYLA
jgi:SAM-dependent methyltransferase